MNVFADYAKKLAEAGLFVIPVAARGKMPLIQGGANAGSTDPAQIEEWAQQFPDANIGVDCGHTGLVILDVDPAKGGVESLKALFKEEPAVKEAAHKTRVVQTGTGGYHYWFKARQGVEIRNSASKDTVGQGLDIRGIGGQAVCPPSVNRDGNPYKWFRKVALDKIPEIPMELVARAKCDKTWKVSEKLTSDPVMEGGRNDYLMRAGCSMRAKGFEHDEIYAALTAMNAGRCNPPLDDDEITQITGSVCRYERGEQLDTALKQMRYEANNGKGNAKKGRRKLEMRTYRDIQKEFIEWLWFGRIPFGKLTLLGGIQGKTKSYLTHAIAAHVSTGRPLPGDYVNLNPEPADVLFITYEDGEGDTVKPRLEKLGADMDRIHSVDMDKAEFTCEDIPALVELLEANPKIRLIIIDPMQNMMVGVDSKTDEEVRQALQPLIRAAARLKVAVLGIKHFNKDESKSIDNRIAGAGYAGVARSIIVAGHDNTKPFGPNHEVFAGCCVIKGNVAGMTHGILYEVNDRGLHWLGEDKSLSLETIERLLPRPPNKKKEKEN